MKILQVVHSFPPYTMGGTEIYTNSLSRELAKNNEVFVFYRVCDRRKKEYDITSFMDNGINIFAINNTFKNCNSFEMTYRNDFITEKFSEILDKIKPDIVHIQHLIFLSTMLIYEIKKRRIPIVFTLHDYWLICQRWFFLKNGLTVCSGDNVKECVNCLREQLSIKKGPKRIYIFIRNILPLFLIRLLKTIYLGYTRIRYYFSDETAEKIKARRRHIEEICSLVDVFIAPSHFLKNKFDKLEILKDKVIFLRHGLDKNIVNNFQKKLSYKIRFGFIGTILPAKGVDILIKAFSMIQKNNAELRIYGKLYPYKGFEYYPSYIKNLAKKKNIRFMGEFHNKDIARLFSEIDVLIVPSLWEETFSLVVQEAFLTKIPVIASNIGAIPEMVKDGINGLLCNPGDLKDLREKLEYIIENPEIINTLKKNMPEIKSMEENAREIEEIYVKLTARNKYEI